MKVLVLNGNPAAGNGSFDAYVDHLICRMSDDGHKVDQILLRDMKIKPCVGCFNCWLKTPGLCSIKDDAHEVSRRYIQADHVILASPLIMGFVSAVLKNAMDRNVPLVHPHLEEVDGEVHHKKRYDAYPVISFVLEKEPFTDNEDITIISDIFRREAINVRSRLGFVHFTDSPVEEVDYAINIH
ncbi:MAG: flavodoxin family protein [Syntrophales bacterium]|nr:flavodoxin family protein [Syntrophales bacterium]